MAGIDSHRDRAHSGNGDLELLLIALREVDESRVVGTNRLSLEVALLLLNRLGYSWYSQLR